MDIRRMLVALALAGITGVVGATAGVVGATAAVAAPAPPPTPAASVDQLTAPSAKPAGPAAKAWVIRADDPVSLIGVAGPVGILAQYSCDAGDLSAFNNGDKAKWKACPERDSNSYKWRAHGSVWCDNSNVQPVSCLVIDGKPVVSELLASGNVFQRKGPNYYQDATNIHIKSFDSPFVCTGTTLKTYQAIFYNLRVTARSGQEGTEKTKFSKVTPYMGGCAP